MADCFQAQTQLEGTYYTKSTQYFIRMMDKFFDCLNVKTPYQWIHKRKENLKPYKDVNDERFKVRLKPIFRSYFFRASILLKFATIKQ